MAKSQLQLWVSIHFDTTEAQTSSLQDSENLIKVTDVTIKYNTQLGKNIFNMLVLLKRLIGNDLELGFQVYIYNKMLVINNNCTHLRHSF